MIITEIQYFFSKIIRFQAIFKDTVEFTCALEFKISSQRCRYIGNRLRNDSVKTVDSFGQLYFIGLHEVCGQSANTRGIGTMTT